MGCGAGILINGLLFPAGTTDFSLLHNVETISGVHRVSYPMDKGAGA
jgi:hypothetical protein